MARVMQGDPSVVSERSGKSVVRDLAALGGIGVAFFAMVGCGPQDGGNNTATNTEPVATAPETSYTGDGSMQSQSTISATNSTSGDSLVGKHVTPGSAGCTDGVFWADDPFDGGNGDGILEAREVGLPSSCTGPNYTRGPISPTH